MIQSQLSTAFVIGGTGMTGGQIVRQLLSSGVRVVATSRKVVDGLPAGPLAHTAAAWASQYGDQLTWLPLDFEGSQVESHLQQVSEVVSTTAGVGAMILAAAYTNVDGCERDPDLCQRVNEVNTIAALNWAKNHSYRSIFFSTDYVFDGVDGPYSEDQKRAPINVYGVSKARVEEWIETHATDALIIRTTGVYDALVGSKNFFMQMMEAGREGRTVRLPADQWANPVWAKELAQASLELLSQKAYGIYHVAGGEVMARHEFAAQIAKLKGLEQLKIEPITTASLNQPARRPLRAGLNCKKLKAALGWAPGAPAQILPQLNVVV